LGTNLEDKESKRKRGVDGEEVAVGKYLTTKKATGSGASEVVPTEAYHFGGQEKKQKKTGGFGDFSGW
jgi:hypothetical protein